VTCDGDNLARFNDSRALAPQSRQTILRELDKVEAGHVRPVALEPPLEKFYKIRAGLFVSYALLKGTLFCLICRAPRHRV